MQFRSPYFVFDGIKSKDLGIQIITTSFSGGADRQFGVMRKINEEVGVSDVPILNNISKETPSFKIQITKATSKKLLSFTEDDYRQIQRWLFKNEYKPFISMDNPSVLYYVIFTSASHFENTKKQGYIELEMKLNAPYGYSSIINEMIYVNGTKNLSIYNESSVNDFIYPDVEIELLDNTSNISITNTTHGESMSLNNLESNEHLYIYNGDIKYIESKIDPKRNLFKNFNKNWLRLRYGKNDINITGKCKVKIIYQIPIPFI